MPKLVRPVPKQDKTELVKGDSAVKKKKETAAAKKVKKEKVAQVTEGKNVDKNEKKDKNREKDAPKVKKEKVVKLAEEKVVADTEEENNKENVGEVAKVAEEVPTKPDTVKTVQADQIGRYWLSLIL